MLYEFRKGVNASKCKRNICEVYGEGTVDDRTCQRWFKRFRSGNFNLEDEPRPGRAVSFDNDLLKAIVKENPSFSIEEIANEMNTSWSSVQKHLKEIGMVSQLGKWVPDRHKESEESKKFED